MLEEKLTQCLSTIVDASAKMGPKAVEFAINNERWNGIVGIFWGLVSLAIVVVCVRWLMRNKDYWDEIGVDFPALGLLNIVAASGFGIGCCMCLFNVWNWIAIFSPKIALGHDIVGKLLSQ